jgi:methionine synthase I (cobalamin-dependent)
VTPALNEPLAPPDATSGAVPRPAWRARRLLDALEQGPLALDAAMGTRLIARGLDLRRDDPCQWNLDRPHHVHDVHRLDAKAGAHVLVTNTFGANRAWLGPRGDLKTINWAGIAVAGCVAVPRRFVLGDIGPSAAGLAGAAGEQAAILADHPIHGLLLETFELPAALVALREVRRSIGPAALPIIVSLWRWPEPVEDAARRLVDAGAAVVGLNCRPRVGEALRLVRRLGRAVRCPILVKPGVDPSDPASESTPAAFAAAVPALVEHGARLIGGCCGTTAEHVAAIAAAIAALPIREIHRRRGAAT